jgi:microcystin-dependent protein
VTQPFLGQIQPFGFNFPPRNWAFCNGQLLSISQNTALFSLLGTFYGGNGTSTFALPNLQSRAPMHFGNDGLGNIYVIGEEAGVETVTLNSNETPVHTHTFSGTGSAANWKQPTAGTALAVSLHPPSTSPGDFYYAPDTNPIQPLNPASVSLYNGGNQPHTNLQPYLAINWCIAMAGIYPSRN